MPKKMLIDATHAEETRVVVVDGNKVEEFDFESENKRQLAGNIYLAKVTRVEPSLQAAFVDYGGNRHGFLAFSEIHPDYYQIPVADREALLAEEEAFAEAMAAEEDRDSKGGRSSRGRSSRSRGSRSSRSARTESSDAVVTAESDSMEVIDLEPEFDAVGDPLEGHSPMDLVEDTPVEEPGNGAAEAGAAGDEAARPGDDAETHDDHDHDDTEDHGIESVAEEDVAEEIRTPRKPRAKKYKIQEVVKVRQIMLVQVVKEERGNKGAALTTYLSLAGRYCVLMPNTARGGGISRKITIAADRKKLKEIAGEIEVPKGAGLIIRTAGAKRTKAEIKRDYEYLQRLWEEIRTLTLKSIAPAKIYEEGNLIKRSIRDLYNRDIDEVFVEGHEGYRVAKDFMKMIMPSHAKNVKLYNEPLPLFARYQVESYLSSMFNPVVQLKSGGYIVIGVTEALVAIDVNSGRATKEGSIEETALKTNLEAAEEVARQLRLRDLAGLIVIDFIDMEERKNNAAVEKRMKDKLKTDRARIQVGRISGFGLMEMSRQRLRPGMIEATTAPCQHCHGTGLIRSDDNLALTILRQLEEEGTRKRSREVLLKAPVSIVNYLMNHKREHIALIEQRYGMGIRLEADAFLISPDYSIEKFKTATRALPKVEAPVVHADASLMEEIDEEYIDEAEEIEEAEAEVGETNEAEAEASAEGDGAPKKKRRRRRRRSRSKSAGNGAEANGGDDDSTDDDSTDGDTDDDSTDGDTDAAVDEAAEVSAPQPDAVEAEAPAQAEVEAPVESEAEAAPKKTVRRSRAKSGTAKATSAKPAAAKTTAAKPAAKAKPAAAKAKPASSRAAASRSKTAKAKEAEAAEATEATEATEAATPAPAEVVEAPTPKVEAAEAPEAAAPRPAPQPEVEDDDPDQPKKKGWWSLGR